MKHIRLIAIGLILIGTMMSSGIAAADSLSLPTVKTVSSFVGDACDGITQVSSTGCNNGQTSISHTVNVVVDILSYLVGVVAVIMIIIAGFRYITSAGDSQGVAAAKNTLIYAIIGIVIAVLAQLIVHYVLHTTTNAAGGFINNSSSIRRDA